MPQLTWDPVDFLSVLGVAPEVGEYETWYRYTVEQPPVRLQITLWQYDADVELLLFVADWERPVLRYSMLGTPGVRVVNDKRGHFLEFAAANTFTGRYDGYSVIPYGLRVWVTPQISIEPFVYPTADRVAERPVAADRDGQSASIQLS
jgi:hypothetical protein